MNIPRSPYSGYWFPPEIIGYCVWLYFGFSVSYRDVEELMAERGVTVSYESIRAWRYKFGRDYAKRIRARRGRLGDTWHLDEVYLNIEDRLQYLWRAVNQDGSVLDILVQLSTLDSWRSAIPRAICRSLGHCSTERAAKSCAVRFRSTPGRGRELAAGPYGKPS